MIAEYCMELKLLQSLPKEDFLLAIQLTTESFQAGEADRSDLAVFEQGQVGHGDTNLFGQVSE